MDCKLKYTYRESDIGHSLGCVESWYKTQQHHKQTKLVRKTKPNKSKYYNLKI